MSPNIWVGKTFHKTRPFQCQKVSFRLEFRDLAKANQKKKRVENSQTTEINQAINQSTNQSTNYVHLNQSINQSIGRSVDSTEIGPQGNQAINWGTIWWIRATTTDISNLIFSHLFHHETYMSVAPIFRARRGAVRAAGRRWGAPGHDRHRAAAAGWSLSWIRQFEWWVVMGGGGSRGTKNVKSHQQIPPKTILWWLLRWTRGKTEQKRGTWPDIERREKKQVCLGRTFTLKYLSQHRKNPTVCERWFTPESKKMASHIIPNKKSQRIRE